MGDVITFFLWIAGLILAVVVIVAQCQLFAIRRLLEALVKQNSPAEPSIAVPPTEIAAPAGESSNAGPPAAGGGSLAPGDKRTLWIVITAVVIIATVLAYLGSTSH